MKAIILRSKKYGLTPCYVSDRDYCALNKFKWGVHESGCKLYAARRGVISDGNKRGATIYMHHLIVPLQPGLETDHRDGNGLNNQRGNLRRVTRKNNIRNGGSRGGTSKFKGVHFSEDRNRWVAQLAGKPLGKYKTEKEAATVYNLAAIQQYGKYAKLNSIQ
jgi:hypothetical protein